MTERPLRQRCGQPTASGRPCRSYVMAGADRCATHLSIAGRERKLTPEIQARLTRLLRGGSPLSVACAVTGLGRSTYYEWWARGDPEGSAKDDALYRVFREQAEQARAEGEAALIAAVVKEAGSGTWQAATWLLERMYPDRWARVSQRENAGAAAKAEETQQEFDAFQEFDELADQRRKKLGGGS